VSAKLKVTVSAKLEVTVSAKLENTVSAKLEDTVSAKSKFWFLKHTKISVCIRAAEWMNVKCYVVFSSPYTVVI
jgi:hypothetical protein